MPTKRPPMPPMPEARINPVFEFTGSRETPVVHDVSGSKFTLRLDAAVTAALLTDEARLTTALGKRPTRAKIILALLALLHDDEHVYSETSRRLGDKTA